MDARRESLRTGMPCALSVAGVGAWLALVAVGCHPHRSPARRVQRVDASVAVAPASDASAPDASAVDGGLAAAIDLNPRTLRHPMSLFDGDDFLYAEWPPTLPTSRPASPRCPVGAGVTMWLSHAPHVPLARVTARGIERAGQPCCEPFAVHGTRWREIDRWGQVVGESTLWDGQYYDVTNCDELTLVPEHHGSSGLFASTSGPWRPPPSARHDPDLDQWAAALTLDDRLHAQETGDHDPVPLPLHSRALFFRASDAPRGRDDGAPTVRLVFGRAGIIIARWERGDWQVERVRPRSDGSFVRPIAVFDLDGDGFPEIVAEEDDRTVWQSVIYKRSAGGEWVKVATAVRGSVA